MTPYHQSTLDAGVTDITVYNKMVLPTSYGDLKAEYDRLINDVAIWDVAAERQVQISGPDAAACVQYLTTRDLSKQKEGQGYYVAMCDHEGHILNDPVLMKLSGGRYWFSIADNDMLLWCKAVARERGYDVTVIEPDVSPLAVQGPKAGDLIADLFGEHTRDIKFFWFIETELDGIPLVLCRSGWSKQGGFELFLQDGSRGDELWAKVMAAGEKYNIGPGAPNHVERVESALLSWGGDNDRDSNPFEVGMARYVHTDIDSDYVGKKALQEILDNGGPKRLLCGLVVDSDVADAWPLPERTPVRVDGEIVGMLSAVVHSHRLGKTIGLAQINRELVEKGDQVVDIDRRKGASTATITAIPFI